MHFATRDMLCIIPAFTSLVWNERFAYWKLQSLWNSG